MLYAGLFFWTLGYDTIYALQDVEDDALIGVKSTAILFGTRVADWILGFYAVSFTLILAAGFAEHAGWPFAFLMFAAGGHMLWQARTLDAGVPERYVKIFRANRDTGGLIGLAFLLSSWIW
jgi:4-hydroxybenzoate polyprenyltransferase